MQSPSLATLLFLIFALNSFNCLDYFKTTAPTSSSRAFALLSPASADQADATRVLPTARRPLELKTASLQPRRDQKQQQQQQQQESQHQDGNKRRPVKARVQQLGSSSARNSANKNNATLWRQTKTFRQQSQEPHPQQPAQPQASPDLQASSSLDLQQELAAGGGADLQVSITPRVGLVQAPVESNAILKCLISAHANKFTRPFKVKWSRFMYYESVYEQIDTSDPFNDDLGLINPTAGGGLGSSSSSSGTKRQVEQRNNRDKRTIAAAAAADEDERPSSQNLATQNSSHAQDNDSSWPPADVPNRQQELRDFLARTRQDTNVISSLLVEAALSISSVKAQDNASYYCTVSDGKSDYNRARIDLLALSKPIVRLDRVEPARDSKSALVHWTIVSDGNAPIKKTILMLRNESQAALATRGGSRYSQSQNKFGPADAPPTTSEQQHQVSSIVLDSERQQWQRIDIEGDGGVGGEDQSGYERDSAASLRFGQSEGGQISDDASVVRADVDVTSLGSLANSNDASSDSPSWTTQGRSGRRNKNGRSFNLTSLLPGVTYQLRLAATNDMGQSNWSQLMATTPNEIPAQISDIVVLSATNDSITIGWRRPLYDGAKTLRYEMQLFDLNRTLTLDANTNTNASGQVRTNFMFHFVNLSPGTDYHFHIRACSRAGCGAYSSPKLLASTLDGEPDEPQDVELTCHLNASGGNSSAPASSSSNLSVSWLPPVNARGKLLNYSVTIESTARYRNHLGQWTSDEWRTTMDTGDNHTLGLEAGNLLMPNTKYTARVCANNRSKKCGRLSQLTQRSTCSTPAELPRELPANIGLTLKQIKLTDVSQDKQQVETLALELPFISLRNGSIDCVQIVLVRLPSSFEGSQRALSDFLPDDPAELEMHDFFALSANTSNDPTTPTPTNNSNNQLSSAFAYLADELDHVNQSGTPEEVARGAKQILLGDGIQSSCSSLRLWTRSSTPPSRQQSSSSGSSSSSGEQRSSRPIQAIDGPLSAQTYYTGFLKLLQIKQDKLQLDQKGGGVSRTARTPITAEGGDELLSTKFSNYFRPVRTGDHVPQVSASLLAGVGFGADAGSGEQELAGPGICAHKLAQQLQEKIGISAEPCLAVTKFAETVRRGVARLYLSAASYLRESVGLESTLDGQPMDVLDRPSPRPPRPARRASPLEIGLVIFVSALLLLFVVYLFTLPSRLRRRSRIKTKRQLMQHEQAAAAAAFATQQKEASHESEGFNQQLGAGEVKLQQQQQRPLVNGQTTLGGSGRPDLQALTTSLGYQQVPPGEHVQVHQSPRQQFASGRNLHRPQECPVHSSPMSAQLSVQQNGLARSQVDAYSPIETDENDDDEDERQLVSIHRDRRQSIHVCEQQAMRAQQQNLCDYGPPDSNHHGHAQHQQSHHAHDNDNQHNQHNHPHPHHHHQHQHHQHQHHHRSAYQLDQSVEFESSQSIARVVDYERNCRTLTRRQIPATAANLALDGQQQVPTAYYNNRLHQVARADNCDMSYQQQQQQQQQFASSVMSARHQTMTMQHNTVLTLAKKFSKPVPLSLFQSVLESRLKNGWLRDEFEQLPRTAQPAAHFMTTTTTTARDDGRHLRLRPQLIVSRDDSISALISGNDQYDGSLIKLPMPALAAAATDASDKSRASGVIEKQFICAKSPTDPDSVWDFWRLIYEREVNTLVMLTPNEDVHTGEIRCAQYWPTCDNEETTILSPCNEFVQQSGIPPAKFKIRQETLSGADGDGSDEFIVRRLTLLVMASKPSENQAAGTPATPNDNENDNTSKLMAASDQRTATATVTAAGVAGGDQVATGEKRGEQAIDAQIVEQPPPPPPVLDEKVAIAGGKDVADKLDGKDDDVGDDEDDEDDDDDEERLVIVERNLLHFQFLHWNASSSSNQTKLIKFIELVNERHARSIQQQASPGADWQQINPQNPMLIHCANGLGRSGLFTAMSFVIDDLSQKLTSRANQMFQQQQQQQQQQQMAAKINLFQLVARMRSQRDMLLSPYRFYELLYQLTARCIPIHGNNNQMQHRHHHHHNHNHHTHNHAYNLTHQRQQQQQE